LGLSDMNLYGSTGWVDLLSGQAIDPENEELVLAPYQTVWITNQG
jgi:sucrose phosphorylase